MKNNPFAEPDAPPRMKPAGPFKFTAEQLATLDALAAEYPDRTRKGIPLGVRSAVVRTALAKWLESDPKAAAIARKAIKALHAADGGAEG